MKRSPDTFIFTAEFGERLRDLRLGAGLTQTELARAMGRAGKSAGNLVSRIEKGDERFPSFALIADFLRGCRASFRDILDVLDVYTSLPTAQEKVFDAALTKVVKSIPQKWQVQVTNYDLQFEPATSTAKPVAGRTQPDRLKRLERARKLAAAARRRSQYGEFLKNQVVKAGSHLTEIDKTTLFNHGLEWFSIHYRTRKMRPATRESRLAASEAEFADASRLPLEVIRNVQDAVKQRFRAMDVKGELDWLPDLALDEYEASLLAPGRKRSLKQQQREEYVRKFNQYDAARKRAVEQVWNEVQVMLDKAGVPKERRPVYRGLVGACCTAATNFEPGSAGERKQIDEHILEPHRIRLGLDTALAEKPAEVILARFRELAKVFTPEPRPRR